MFSMKEQSFRPFLFSFRMTGPWAKSWDNLFPSPKLGGCYRPSKVEYHFFDTFTKGYSALIIEVFNQESVHRCSLECSI